MKIIFSRGRFTNEGLYLSKDIISKLNLSEKDSIEISHNSNCIIIKKAQNHCYFCGNLSNNIYNDKHTCDDCLKDLKS